MESAKSVLEKHTIVVLNESLKHGFTQLPRFVLKDKTLSFGARLTYAYAYIFWNLEQLSHYQGQVVLLNFWTGWCIPCKEEIPGIQSIYEAYREQGFVVLTINISTQDDRAEDERFVDELQGSLTPVAGTPDPPIAARVRNPLDKSLVICIIQIITNTCN